MAPGPCLGQLTQTAGEGTRVPVSTAGPENGCRQTPGVGAVTTGLPLPSAQGLPGGLPRGLAGGLRVGDDKAEIAPTCCVLGPRGGVGSVSSGSQGSRDLGSQLLGPCD